MMKSAVTLVRMFVAGVFVSVFLTLLLFPMSGYAENTYIWPQGVIGSFSDEVWVYTDFDFSPCWDRGELVPTKGSSAGVFCGGIVGVIGESVSLSNLYVISDEGGLDVTGGEVNVVYHTEVGNCFHGGGKLASGGNLSVGGGTLNGTVHVCSDGVLTQGGGTIKGPVVLGDDPSSSITGGQFKMTGGTLDTSALAVLNEGEATIGGTSQAKVCGDLNVMGQFSLLKLKENAQLQATIFNIFHQGTVEIHDSATIKACDGSNTGVLMRNDSSSLNIFSPVEIYLQSLSFNYEGGTTRMPTYNAPDGTLVTLSGHLIIGALVDGIGLQNTEFVFEDNTTNKRIFTHSEDRGCIAEGFVSNNALKKVTVGNANEEGLYLEITETAGDKDACYIEEIYLSPNSTINVPAGLTLYYKRLTLSPGSSIQGDTCQVDAPVTHQLGEVADPVWGGVLSCNPNPVPDGETSLCTAVPNDHYQVVDFGGDCGGIRNGDTYTTNAITAFCTVSVGFLRTYVLIVNGGAGSGEYEAGKVINVAADPPPQGKVFDKWIGQTAHLANPDSAGTTVTMPEEDVTVTATYKDKPVEQFTLVVVNGTGGGLYEAGHVVGIAAAPPAQGKIFDQWTGDVAHVANVKSANTTVTMPEGDVTVTATYRNLYALTVAVSPAGRGAVIGNGINCPGDCTEDYNEGTDVRLTANPETGNKFLCWKGSLTGTGNPDTLTMNGDKETTAYFGATSGNTDTDGVPDNTESGPGADDPSYDGNNNGIPDYQEPGTASLLSASGGAYATVAVAGGSGQVLTNVQAVNNPSPGDAPEGVQFPYGFFSFSIDNLANPGDRATATIYLPKNTSINTYYQYGPMPANPADHWYEFLYDGDTGTQIFQDAGRTRIVLHFRDGARGDKDLTANGRIDDPGAPGAIQQPVSAVSVPTLDEWGMILLALCLAVSAMTMLRRRYRI